MIKTLFEAIAEGFGTVWRSDVGKIFRWLVVIDIILWGIVKLLEMR